MKKLIIALLFLTSLSASAQKKSIVENTDFTITIDGKQTPIDTTYTSDNYEAFQIIRIKVKSNDGLKVLFIKNFYDGKQWKFRGIEIKTFKQVAETEWQRQNPNPIFREDN